MKRNYRILFFLSVAIVTLSSCLSQGKEEHTPDIFLSNFYTQHSDSVEGKVKKLYITEDGYRLDTITLADSIYSAVNLYTYANNLRSFVIEYDTTELRYCMISSPEFEKVLLAESDIAHGKYYFPSGYNQAWFGFYLYPLKEGKHKLSMTLTGDGEFPTRTLKFEFPVKP